MKNKRDVELLLSVFRKGIDLQYKHLVLCNLSNLGLKNGKFQVHLEGKYSSLFSSDEEAVEKFLEIKESYHVFRGEGKKL